MPLFEDADDVYATLGRLFTEITGDGDDLAPGFRRADTIVRHELREPEAVITVRLQPGEAGQVDCGQSEMEPEVTMRMAADTAHRFWLGRVDVAAALARGEIEASGPVAKKLSLVSLARPAFERYRQQLIDQGRADLARA